MKWIALWLAGLAGAVWAADNLAAYDRPDFRQVVQQAKDQVFPTVVFIKCLREDMASGKKVVQEVSGSGVIISATGEVVTNHHVIDKATEIRCLLYDGKALYGKLVGSDKDTDLALVQLQLDRNQTVAFAQLGDSTSLKEGDFVMAMGAPWGLSRSVSIGIIACTRRYLPDSSEYNLWLQTDASICPGNSGGPLVNTDGQVIGINALGSMMGGDLGFAIPSETVRDIVPQFRRSGKADWSWLGLQLQALRDFNRNVYFDAAEGVIVAETDPESPARHAGIAARDRIIRIDGKPTTATTEEYLPAIRRLIGVLEKNKTVKVELVRNQQTMTVELTPTEKGKVEGEELDCPRWDLTIKTINQFDNPDLYFHRKQGVFIFGIKYPGNASDGGLREQDIVLSIDGQETLTLEDVKVIHKKAIAGVDSKRKCVFAVLRNGLMKQVVLDFGRDYEKQ